MATVRVEDRNGIALVTLDRPPANAMAPDLLTDALAVVAELESSGPAAAVLTGAGAFFSGGADLRLVPSLSADDQADMARDVNRLFAGWHGFRRPLVSAVNGHAVAGGFILALCGDHRIVATSGRFGLTEVKVGIPYPSAAMAVVKAELPPPVARRLVLRAELLSGAEMVALGAFDEQVPDDRVVERAFEMAAELAALPPITYELVKQRLRSSTAASGTLGGAARAGWATSEAATAASAVLDRGR